MGHASGGAAAATRLPHDRPTSTARVLGVILRPRATFAAVATAPKWAGVLALSTAVAAGAAAGFYSTGVGRQALVDRWERTAAVFGREVDDAAYAELLRLGEYSTAYGVASAVAGVALLTVAVAMLAFVFLPRRDGRPTFRQVMAVVSHASVILALRFVVAAPIGYARETETGVTSLGTWMPIFSQTSLVSRFLAMLDVMLLWWAIVAAVGIAVVYGRPVRPIALSFVGAYVAVALAIGVIMTMLGSA